MPISAAVRRQVRQRAANLCEYCHLHQDELPFVTFHVEHVIARQHEGLDEFQNLCLSCHWCNLNKGPNISTMVDSNLTPLFHPRRDRWNEHFERRGELIEGLTAVGRGTVRLLDMNDEDRRRIRLLTKHTFDV